ncbi:MAG: hypothetical protein NC314_05330 [Roseburia sp.]|nr:hypothetical protein [Roseburia sp.]MCM1242243.1 hypothetical protein [Roseburia sp.]
MKDPAALKRVYILLEAYRQGQLGGEKMPEDENPHLDISSKENYMYFTLPMSLNYQRNSYVLWECANKSYADSETRDIFDPAAVIGLTEEQLRSKLLKYKDWLYVMEQYTDVRFTDRENITVAPDTHVIQASERLGIISAQEMKAGNIQEIVAERWKALLKETDLVPIDVHTPMWLWSRGKFSVDI